MKILNLYACLGGNRYKWDEVTDVEVTAVELDPILAELYQQRFPGDKVIIADAHQYLLDYYQEFDFIWSSPPCPSHSRARYWGFGANGKNPIYPDMTLYQEIIFLQHHFKGKYCIENVIPYYEPMFSPKKRGRHLYWTNFELPTTLSNRKVKISEGRNEVKNLCKFHEYDFFTYKGKQPINKIARNLVDYQAGKTILEVALNIQVELSKKQESLF
tara:strand:+ start:42 stop:686 length:645 start_codon:yes stop_codon:yes gene_type:complete